MADVRDRVAAALERSSTPAASVAASSAHGSFAFVVGDVADETVRFQAASISKTVTAEVILDLVRDGAVDLDGDVFDVVPELRPASGKAWRPRVTTRMVLAHRAGFVDDSGFPGYLIDTDVPTPRDVLVGAGHVNSAPLRIGIVPGTQFRYSGVGYLLLSMLIERVTGEPFAEVARTRVFEPAGMSTATFERATPGDPSFATGHLNGQPIPGGWHVYPELGAAAMWCTASDLLGLHRRVTARPPEWLASEGRSPLGAYGLGIVRTDHAISHDGGNRGFVCTMAGTPDGAHRFAVMTNGEDPSVLRSIAAVLAREIGWDAMATPPDEPSREALVAAVVGEYADDTHRAVIGQDADGITFEVDDQAPLPLSFVPPDLTAPGMAFTIRIVRDETGRRVLSLRQPGFSMRLADTDPG